MRAPYTPTLIKLSALALLVGMALPVSAQLKPNAPSQDSQPAPVSAPERSTRGAQRAQRHSVDTGEAEQARLSNANDPEGPTQRMKVVEDGLDKLEQRVQQTQVRLRARGIEPDPALIAQINDAEAALMRARQDLTGARGTTGLRQQEQIEQLERLLKEHETMLNGLEESVSRKLTSRRP